MSFRITPFRAIVLAILFLVPASAVVAICKWVDENGVTHYAEHCPDEVGASEIEIQPPPEHPADAAGLGLLQPGTRPSAAEAPQPAALKFESLPSDRLGPLPQQTTSSWLQTTGADISYDLKSRTGRFHLTLKALDSLPAGAVIEARFPDPGNPDRSYSDEVELKFPRAAVRLQSPGSGQFVCWNYEVVVSIYSDNSKSQLLGTHRQVIQSRIDMKQIPDPIEWTAILAGNSYACPSAHQARMQKMTVEQLEALCESEREKRLKPERDRLIGRCIEAGKKQEEWCRNYYADYGDAVRLDPVHVRPALYYDLPECIAAKKARQESGGP